jgi:hypothetical protein
MSKRLTIGNRTAMSRAQLSGIGSWSVSSSKSLHFYRADPRHPSDKKGALHQTKRVSTYFFGLGSALSEGLQTPHAPPPFLQCAQLLQLRHASHRSAPVHVAQKTLVAQMNRLIRARIMAFIDFSRRPPNYSKHLPVESRRFSV